MFRLALCAVLATALAPSPAPAAAPRAAVNVSSAAGPSTSPGAVADRAGNIHVVWTDDPGSSDASTQRVYYSRSADGGTTFEAPRLLSGATDAAVRPREARVVVAPSGAVFVAWWAYVPAEGGRTFSTVFVARSVDGGASFAPAAVTSMRFDENVAAAKEGFYNATSLSLAAGPSDEIYLLATVQDYFHGFNVYFASSDDGVEFSRPKKVTNYTLTLPRATTNVLAVLPNGSLYAAWTESYGDFADEIKIILSATSTDGGRTFSAPRRVAKASGLVGGATGVGSRVYLLTQLMKTPKSRPVIQLFRSTNGGAAYGARAKIAATDTVSHLNQASVAMNDAGMVAVAWLQRSYQATGVQGVFAAVSRDGGKTFSSPVLVVEGQVADAPAVTLDAAGNVGVVFTSPAVNLIDRDVYFSSVTF
jgi:hypothetical protein